RTTARRIGDPEGRLAVASPQRTSRKKQQVLRGGIVHTRRRKARPVRRLPCAGCFFSVRRRRGGCGRGRRPLLALASTSTSREPLMSPVRLRSLSVSLPALVLLLSFGEAPAQRRGNQNQARQTGPNDNRQGQNGLQARLAALRQQLAALQQQLDVWQQI